MKFFVVFLVPPTQLIILDNEGATMTDNLIGPYREGANINITCMSSGGIPAPRVSWWREHALVDDSYNVLADGTVKNVLHLSKLTRKDLHVVSTVLSVTFSTIYFNTIYIYLLCIHYTHYEKV